ESIGVIVCEARKRSSNPIHFEKPLGVIKSRIGKVVLSNANAEIDEFLSLSLFALFKKLKIYCSVREGSETIRQIPRFLERQVEGRPVLVYPAEFRHAGIFQVILLNSDNSRYEAERKKVVVAGMRVCYSHFWLLCGND